MSSRARALLTITVIISTHQTAWSGTKARNSVESNCHAVPTIVDEKLLDDDSKIRSHIEYDTVPMGSNEKGRANFLKNMDRMNGVPYLDAKKRQKYRAKIASGLMYTANGSLLGWSLICRPTVYLYVMDKSGNFFVGSDKDVIHHSAFLAGEPVASAGHIKIMNGKVQMISNESGHYKSDFTHFQQAIVELERNGVTEFEQKIWKN